MEEAFENLKRSGNNNVQGIIQWLKESKVIDGSKEASDKVAKMFEGCADKNNLQLDDFKQAVTKLSEEQKISPEQLGDMLASGGNQMMESLGNAANSLAGAFK